MDVWETIKQRRSIRHYQEKPIEQEKLHQVLEAARWAPSARNLQNWKFVVTTDPKKLEALTDACLGQSFVAQAPCFIAVCAVKDEGLMACGMPRHIVDASIAMTHIVLQAHALGLGTCWLGSFDQDKVKRILQIPDQVTVVATTPLGYPEKSGAAPKRKSFEQVVCYEKYE